MASGERNRNELIKNQRPLFQKNRTINNGMTNNTHLTGFTYNIYIYIYIYICLTLLLAFVVIVRQQEE